MAKLTINERVAGANSGTADLSILRNIKEIQLNDDFKNMFPKNETMVQTIADDMKVNGYDMSQPVHIWKEQKCLIDGHHRFYAAEVAGIKEIPVYEHSFPDIETAMEYALKLQVQRRNLNDAELYAAVKKLDTIKKRGRKAADADNEPAGKSADHLGEILGTSGKKIEKIRAIEKKATEEVKRAVADGAMSINAGWQTTKKTAPKVETKPAAKPEKIEIPESETIEKQEGDPFDIGFEADAITEENSAIETISLNVKFTLDKTDVEILRGLLAGIKKNYGIDFEM